MKRCVQLMGMKEIDRIRREALLTGFRVIESIARRKPDDIDFIAVGEKAAGEYSNAGGNQCDGSEREFVVQRTVLSRVAIDRFERDAILAELAPAVADDIGIAASANLERRCRCPSKVERTHSSAPDIAGQGTADLVAAPITEHSNAYAFSRIGYMTFMLKGPALLLERSLMAGSPTELESSPNAIFSAWTATPKGRPSSFSSCTGVGRVLISQGSDTVMSLALILVSNAPFVFFGDLDWAAAVLDRRVPNSPDIGKPAACGDRIHVQDGVRELLVGKSGAEASAVHFDSGENLRRSGAGNQLVDSVRPDHSFEQSQIQACCSYSCSRSRPHAADGRSSVLGHQRHICLPNSFSSAINRQRTPNDSSPVVCR